jgi:NIPSNAP
MLAWQSLAVREMLWAAFAGDPEWHAIVAETEKDGPPWQDISNQLLVPTAFSSVR